MALEYRVFSEQLEILRAGAAATPSRVSSVTVEILRDGASDARTSSVVIEVLRSRTTTTTAAWVVAESLEVLRTGIAAVNGRVGSVILEVLRSVAIGVSTRRRIPMIHSF